MFVLVFEFVFVVEFVLVFVVEFVLVEFILLDGVGVEVSILGVALVKGKFGLTPLTLDLFVLVLTLAVPLQAKPNAPIPINNEIAMIFFIFDFSCFLYSNLI